MNGKKQCSYFSTVGHYMITPYSKVFNFLVLNFKLLINKAYAQVLNSLTYSEWKTSFKLMIIG
jgi:hypothetical protein